MNGAAPKSPEMGSQTTLVKNPQPNAARDCLELIHSSYTSSEVMSRMLAAKRSVMRCAISSPSRRRFTKARGPAFGGTACSIVVAVEDILRDGFLLTGPDY